MTEFVPYPVPGFRDPASALSHLLGAAVFAGLTPLLLRRGRGHPGRLFCLGLFAFAVVLQLSVSGVYHLLGAGAGRAVLQRLDHAAIFVLIAGTNTPVYGVLFRGPGRWLPLLLIWSLAATAVTLKVVFFNDVPELLGVLLYLGLGWFGAHGGWLLWRRYGAAYVAPLLYGGLAYSAGAVLEFLRTPTLWAGVVGPHELFHLFVLLGAAFHWWFVFRLAPGVLP